MKQSKSALIIYLLKWLGLSTVIGVLMGSVSAVFLKLLDWATLTRENSSYLLYFLPVGGFLTALLYHFYGQDVKKGNNLILDEIHKPKNILKLRMAPMILLGTIVTHLFGGSAGREGTAVQIGASISDQLTHIFKFNKTDRKNLLIAGMAAGFGSVFGTPLAGGIFGLEVFLMGKMKYESLLPAFFSSIIANEVAQNWWGIKHSKYVINNFPELTFKNIVLACAAGICFGIAGKLFSMSIKYVKAFLFKYIKFQPYHAFVGGILIILLTKAVGTYKYNGLGLETIMSSFSNQLPVYDFLFKIIFTAVTLGSGFKGGEITCLFFVGSTLGNALSRIIKLPMSLLSGMGFVGVFAAAANTPIACTVMAIELFGKDVGVYAAIACLTAYLFSGHSGIYESQVIGNEKHFTFFKDRGKKIGEV